MAAFVVFAVIARLIGPEEYGLVALCGLFVPLSSNIVNGMVDAVVSMRIRDDSRLSTLFWFVNLCGAGIGLLSYVVARPLADFMGDARIEPLLQSFSVIPFLLALASVPTALVLASMNFRVFTIRTLVAALLSGIAGIAMAMKGFGAYAMAGQHIVLNLVINIIVWPSCGWRPRLIFSFAEMSETLRLGMKQAGSSLVSSLEQQLPRFLLGYFINPLAVGQYTFVLRICAAFQDVLVQPMLSVIYPAFALIRDDHHEQKKILGQVVVLFGGLIFPALALAIATAPVYLPLLFGKRWEETIPLLQLMLVATATTSLSFILRDLLRAHKLIGAYLRWQTMIFCGGTLVSAALVSQGLYVFMAVGVVASFVGFVVYTVLAGSKTKIYLWSCYARLGVPLAASAALFGAVVAFMNSTLRPANSYLVLACAAGIGMTVYAAAYGAMQYRQIKALISFVSRMRKREAMPEPMHAAAEDL